MPFSELTGITTKIDPIEARDGTSNTLMLAEKYAAQGGEAPAGMPYFTEVAGIGSETEVVEAKDGTGNTSFWASDWIL